MRLPLPRLPSLSTSFSCTAPASTNIYTLSLHDALPICSTQIDFIAELAGAGLGIAFLPRMIATQRTQVPISLVDRKSTRLNSSHLVISYAVFCLKKKTRIGKGTNNTAHSKERTRYRRRA